MTGIQCLYKGGPRDGQTKSFSFPDYQLTRLIIQACVTEANAKGMHGIYRQDGKIVNNIATMKWQEVERTKK